MELGHRHDENVTRDQDVRVGDEIVTYRSYCCSVCQKTMRREIVGRRPA